ncbi:MAG TPA: hypothetical protein VHU15_11860 [Stellaceae bacterium]|jgi:hypothetical protein|nr:hypothetical protein [Stellaceae bacterium]
MTAAVLGAVWSLDELVERTSNMSITQKHRDTFFAVSAAGHSEWEWICYPPHLIGQQMTGKVIGTEQEAEAACKKAIDAAFDGPPSN